MRKLITGIVIAGASLFTLAGCTPAPAPAPAPTVTVTTTVTATPAPAEPLAELHYTSGGATDTSLTFVAPTAGYAIVATCKAATDRDLYYTRTSPDKVGFGGTDYITCDGTKTVAVETASDLDFFKLGGKTLDIKFQTKDLTDVSALDVRVIKLDL